MHSLMMVCTALFSAVIYPLVAWSYAALAGHNAITFGIALAILVGAKLLSAMTDYMSDALAWQIFGRRAFVKKATIWLQVNRFPMRKDEDSTFPSYLMDIKEGFGYADSLKSKAEVITHGLLYAEALLPRSKARRVWGAWNAAMDIYSPKTSRRSGESITA
jgi:hypothetical protein